MKINEFDNLRLNINLSDCLCLSDYSDRDKDNKRDRCILIKDRCVFSVSKSRSEGEEEDAILLYNF